MVELANTGLNRSLLVLSLDFCSYVSDEILLDLVPCHHVVTMMMNYRHVMSLRRRVASIITSPSDQGC